MRAAGPGLLVSVGIAALAMAGGSLVPVLGAPVIAIVCGILLAVVWGPVGIERGVRLASTGVLQASVVVLGFGLSLGRVLSAGAGSLPVLIGTLVIALLMAALVGRLLGLRGDLRVLIGVGTAICGASAIAATDAVIGADEADVSYAIATIFTFNVIAVLLYPTIGHALSLSQHSFGLWAGTAINDVSSVVAASTVYGPAAVSFGVVVKLTRTLAIIPIAATLASRRAQPRVEGVEQTTGRVFKLRNVVPMFVLAFVTAAALNTLGLVPAGWHHGLSELASWLIATALAAIGLSTNPSRIRATGLRPLGLGAALWATVGLASLGLQVLTGTL